MPKKKLSTARKKSKFKRKISRSVASRKNFGKQQQKERLIAYQQELRELEKGLKKKSFSQLNFSQLENLISLAKKAQNKKAVRRYQKLYHQKEKNWANSLLKGQQKLKAYHEKKRLEKHWKQETELFKQQAQQAKKTRLKEIYAYFSSQLKKLDRKECSNSPFFTAHLDLDRLTLRELKKKQQQYPEYDFYAEFKKNPKNLTYQLNKEGQRYLFKQTQQAYQEEVNDQKSQILWWQERAGLTKTQATNLVRKGQKIKLFFPEKGEHADFWKKNKEFKKFWAQIQTYPGEIKTRQQLAKISQELYQKSPWRIRDRWPVPTNQPSKSFSIREIFEKYYKNNPDPHTKKHYLRAIGGMLRKTDRGGEIVPESELDLDKYGNPRLKEGQVIALNSNKPGKRWTVYKNVPDLEVIVKEQVHEVAQGGYIEEYGTELEIQTWKLKKDKALCWIEAVLGEDCSANQGASGWWCLQCIMWGPYHIPQLTKHCPWKYTYKTWLCGTKEHSDANKQWHWSLEGEKTRSAIKGGDWGSCHIATYDRGKREKQKRK